ncbi:MAG: hypothetical protein ACFBZ8_06540 [Opitutales bacterium]
MKKYTRLLRAGFAAAAMLGLSPLSAQILFLDFEGETVGALFDDTTTDFGFPDDNQGDNNNTTFEITGGPNGSATIVDVAGDKKLAFVSGTGDPTFEDLTISFGGGGFDGSLIFDMTTFADGVLGFSEIDASGDLVTTVPGAFRVFVLGTNQSTILIEDDGVRMTGFFSDVGKVFYSDVGFVDTLEPGVEYQVSVIIDSNNNQVSVAIDSFIIINRVSPNTGSIAGFGETRIGRQNTNTTGDATILVDNITRPGFPFVQFPATDAVAFDQSDIDDANGNSGNEAVGADFTSDGADLVGTAAFDFDTVQSGLEGFNTSISEVGWNGRWEGEGTSDGTFGLFVGVNGNTSPDRINASPEIINNKGGTHTYLFMLPKSAFSVDQGVPFAFDGSTSLSLFREFVNVQIGPPSPFMTDSSLVTRRQNWVVRNGTEYYIDRNSLNEGNFGVVSLTDPNNQNWELVDPTTPEGFAALEVDNTGGSTFTFDDVTGVGWLVELTVSTDTTDDLIQVFDQIESFTINIGGSLTELGYFEWISQFVDPTSDPTAARDFDLDGDGCTNVEEFMFGGDPTDPDSKFIFQDFVISEGEMYLLLSVRQNSSSGEVVDFEAGDDLTVETSFAGFDEVDGTVLALKEAIVENNVIQQDFRVVIARAANPFGSQDIDLIRAKVEAPLP